MRTTDDLVHFLRDFRQGGIVNFTLTAGTIDMLKESADLLEWYAKRVAWLERPRSPRCDDCASGDHSTHDRKNDCGNWIEYQCECRGPETLTDAEVAEWNHADCDDDCQAKAIEKLVCMVCGSDSGCAETHIPKLKRLP
jgi:hypothetical protein